MYPNTCLKKMQILFTISIFFIKIRMSIVSHVTISEDIHLKISKSWCCAVNLSLVKWVAKIDARRAIAWVIQKNLCHENEKALSMMVYANRHIRNAQCFCNHSYYMNIAFSDRFKLIGFNVWRPKTGVLQIRTELSPKNFLPFSTSITE